MGQYESYLDYIPHGTRDYILDHWVNGAIGSISDHAGRFVYRFYEHFYDIRGLLAAKSLNDEDASIVAVGIVAYW